MTPEIIALLVILHFIGDFLFQSDYVARNKSKNSLLLLKHVILYAMPFAWLGVWFFLITAALHFAIDYATSRATTYMYQKNIHWFFVIIGFDQMLHMLSLVFTYKFLFLG